MKCHDPQTKLLNHLALSNQKGFTIVELLVAFAAVTLFVSFALQGMVLASLAQIRAKEKAEASLIIQQNLEGIRSLAARYLRESPLTTELELEIDARCDGTGGTSADQGIADGLSAAINDNPELAIPDDQFTATASRRSYPFTRVLTPSQTNRNLLEIRYEITDPVTDNILAELSTEVIPDVSLQCP